MSGLVKNIGWSVIGQISNVLIVFVANLVLAYFLKPDEFGKVNIVMFFVTISNILTDSGFGGALVRKLEISDSDYSTVFIFNSIISIVLCLFLIAFSGLISSFYNDDSLTALISFSCLIIIFNGVGVVQTAKGYRYLKFKDISLISILSSIAGVLVAVIMAWRGMGIWALLTMYAVTSLIKSILLWQRFGAFQLKKFNRSSFRSLYKYGIYTTINSLLNNGMDNIFSLILPKYFSNSISGLYYQGKKIQSVPFTIFNTLALSVFFSHLAKYQKSLEEFKKEYLKGLTFFLTSLAFISGCLFILSDVIVRFLFKSEWSGASLFIKLIIPGSFLLIAKIFSQNILKVFNKTEKIFYVEIIGAFLQLGIILFAITFKNLVVFFVFSSISILLTYILLSYQSWSFLKNSFVDEVKLFGKLIFISVISLSICYFVSNGYFGLLALTFIRIIIFSTVFIILIVKSLLPLGYISEIAKQLRRQQNV